MIKKITLLTTAIIFGGMQTQAQWASSPANIYPEDLTKNVGIGTDIPTYKLDIKSSLDNFRQLRVTAPGSPLIKLSGGYNSGDGGEWWQSTTGDMLLNINSNTTGLFIKSNGNIGIGTVTPKVKLDVNGAISIQNNSDISWGGAFGPGIPTIAATVNGGIYFYPAGSSSGTSMLINHLGNIGVGTINPQVKLDIIGNIKITDGTQASGKVLTSDANGTATWQNPTDGGWGLTGTAGTVDGTNFIGTTDNVPFNIRVNNQKAGRIDANNAFYGYQSGNARTTGGYNTANGYQALYANKTGDGNTAIGDRSLLANTIGNYNTAVGSLALSSNIDGKYNTAIGYAADVQKGFSNSTAIGNNTIVNANNKIRLGDASITEVETQFKYTTVSDGRFKTNISESDIKGLEFIKKLRPVVYNFDTKKFQAFLTQNMPADVRKVYMNKDFSASTAIRQSGFIAQEVEKAAQEVGYEFNGIHKPENANDNYSLAYSQFVVPLVKAVQELDKKDEQKDKQIEQLQKEKEQQQKINEQLQQRMEALEKLIAGNSHFSNELVNKILTSSEAEGLKLFPNPTTGIFTIMANHITNATIEVYDMLGNGVKKEMSANIKSGYQLDLSGHAKGTYWVNIISGNKKYTKQIVVQ